MKRYSVLQAPAMAFFNGDFYKDVARNWTGIGFLYLTMLFAVAWLISTASVTIPMVNFIDKEMPKFTSQFPTVTINDGQMSMDRPSPYDVVENGVTIMRFDMESEQTELGEDDPPILFTRKHMVQKSTRGTDNGAQQVMEYSKLPLATETKFGPTEITNFMGLIKFWYPIIVFVIVGPIVLICHFLQVLLYALIGLAIAAMMNVKLPFDAMMRLTVMAITPAVVISTVLQIISAFVQITPVMTAWMFASVLVALGYLAFGIKNAKDDTEGGIAPSAPAMG